MTYCISLNKWHIYDCLMKYPEPGLMNEEEKLTIKCNDFNVNVESNNYVVSVKELYSNRELMLITKMFLHSY